jgi:hypothetical protein
VKPEEDAPSAKAEHDITRISNVLVKSTVFDETFRLERFGIGIDVLVTRHAPAGQYNTLSWRILGRYKGTDHKLAITTDPPGT